MGGITIEGIGEVEVGDDFFTLDPAGQQEYANEIARQISSGKTSAGTFATAQPDEGTSIGGFGDALSGIATGFTTMVPLAVEGAGALAYSAGLTDDLNNSFVRWGRQSQKEVRDFFGGDSRSHAYGFGNALGSFASFFIPGLGAAGLAAKGLSLGAKGAVGAQRALNLAAKTTKIGGTGGLAVGAGAGEQAERILNIAETMEGKYPAATENLKLAILTGGAVGLTELAPVALAGRFASALVSRGLPKSLGKDVTNKILANVAQLATRTAPRRVASVGLAEGGQEALAGYLQDLTERGLYNPDLEIGQSAAADFGYGGSAGAFFQTGIELVLGRRNRGRPPPTNQQEAEQEQIEREAAEAAAAAGESTDPLALPAPEPQLLLPDLSGRQTPLVPPEANVPELVNQTVGEIGADLPLSFNNGSVVVTDDAGTPDSYNVTQNDEGIFVTSKQGTRVSPNFSSPEQASEFKDGLNVSVNEMLVQQDEIETERQAKEAVQRAKLEETSATLDAARATISSPSIDFSSVPGDAAQAINVKRGQTGRNALNAEDTVTLEELSDNNVSQEIIDGLLPVSQPATAGDVRSSAASKNILVEDAGFERFARRNTGSANIDRMSPTQLGYMIDAIEGLPAIPGETAQALPVIQAPEFTGPQYNATIALANRKGEEGVLKSEISKNIDMKRGSPTESLIDSGVSRGDLIPHPTKKNRWVSRRFYEENRNRDSSPLERGEQIEAEARAAEEAAQVPEVALPARETLGPGIVVETTREEGDTRSIPERSRAFQERLGEVRPTPEAMSRRDEIQQSLTDELNRFAASPAGKAAKLDASKISVQIVDSVTTEAGKRAEGQLLSDADSGKVIIQLALDVAQEGAATDAQVKNNLRDVFNHEVVHALKALGVINEADMASLVKYSKNARIKGSKKTIYQEIVEGYTEENVGSQLSKEEIEEEAVADAFRYWAAGQLKVTGKPRNIFDRIVRFFRSIGSGLSNAQITSAEQVFGNLRAPPVQRSTTVPAANREAAAQADQRARERGESVGDAPSDAYDTKYSLYPAQLDALAAKIAGVENKVEEIGGQKVIRKFRVTDLPDYIKFKMRGGQKLTKAEQDAIKRQRAVINGKYSLARKPIDPKDPVFTSRNSKHDNAEVAGKSLPLRGKARRLSVLDILYNENLLPRTGSSTGYVARLLQERARKVLGGKPINIESDTSKDGLLSDVFAAEAIAALEETGNAATWYSEKVTEAIDVASQLYPEIATDADARFAFLAALSVTSQNTPVMENSVYTSEVYEYFRENQRFPESFSKGKHGKSMASNFVLLNALLDEMGPAGVRTFFDQQFTVKQLENAGFKPPSGENVDTVVYGSFLLGPKIGQGFYQNLNGNFSPVTIDMWLMRTVGRVTGRIIGKPEILEKQADRLLKGLLADPDKRGDNFRISVIRDAQIDGNVDALVEVANEFRLEHDRIFATPEVQALFRAKKYNKPEWAKAAEAIITQQNKPQDSPSGGNFRNGVRRIMEKTRKKMADSGYDVTNADLQAILWYPEKNLYKKLGVRTKANLNIDYAQAFSKIINDRSEADAQGNVLQPVGRGVGTDAVDVQGRLPDDGIATGEIISDNSQDGRKFSLPREVIEEREARIKYDESLGVPADAYTATPLSKIAGPSTQSPSGAHRIVINNRGLNVYFPLGFDKFSDRRNKSFGFGARHVTARKHNADVPLRTNGLYKNITDLAAAALNSYWPVRNNPAEGGFTVTEQKGPYGNPMTRMEWRTDTFGYPAVLIFDSHLLGDVMPSVAEEFANVRVAYLRNGFVGASDGKGDNPVPQPAVSVKERSPLIKFAVERGMSDVVVPEKRAQLKRDTLRLKAKYSLKRSEENLTPDQKKILNDRVSSSPNQTFFERIMESFDLTDPSKRSVALRIRRQVLDNYAGIRAMGKRAQEVAELTAEAQVNSAIGQLERKRGVVAAALNIGPLVRFGGQVSAINENIVENLQNDEARAQFQEAFERLQRETQYTETDPLTGEQTVIRYESTADLKGLAEILSEIDQQNEWAAFVLYAASRRANRLAGENREKTFTPAEIEEGLRIGSDKPAIARAYRNYQLWNASLVLMMKDTGVISEDAAQLWIDNADYLPFYRQSFDNEGVIFETSGVDVQEGASGEMNFKADMNSPINNMLPNLFNIKAPKELKGGKPYYFVMVNDVADGKSYESYDAAQDRLKQLKQLNGNDVKLRVNKSNQKIDNPIDNILRNLDAGVTSALTNVVAARAVRDLQRLGLAKRQQAVDRNSPNPDLVGVRVNGETKYYEVQDHLLLATMGATGNHQSMALDVLATPANLLRELITKDPGFMAANMLRDSLSAWVTSGITDIPGPGTFGGFVKTITKDPSAQALEASGVVGGYDAKQDKDAVKLFRKMNRAKQRGGLNPITWWNKWDDLSLASDTATRVAVFEKVLALTNGNIAAANTEALDVINFSRKGASNIVRMLTAVVPFLNARVQGLDVLYRSGTRGDVGTTTTMTKSQRQRRFYMRALTIVGLSAAYAMASAGDDDNEWYKNATEVDKDNYWIIPPTWFGLDVDSSIPALRIPIPFEVGVLFKVIPERIVRTVRDQVGVSDNIEAAMRHIMGTFAINPVPQAFLPALESVANYNTFTGRNIVTYWDEKLEPEEASPDFVAPFAIELSRELREQFNIDFEAKKIDHLFRGYTGTLGSYALMAADGVMRSAAGMPERPTRRLDQYPVLGRFIQEQQGTGPVASFYDVYNEVQQYANQMSRYEKQGRLNEMDKYYEQRRGIPGVKDYVGDLAKELSEMRNLRNMVSRDPVMSTDEKAENLERIQEDMNSLVSEILKDKQSIIRRTD
tara:strand:- start:650 stop:9142 length:8493 start_codon:yes stop_codon:yes gene_type:complete